MDKRSLLVGFGIGIVVGSLLMQLFLVGEQSTKQLNAIDQTLNGLDDEAPSLVAPFPNENSNFIGIENDGIKVSPTPTVENTLNEDDSHETVIEEDSAKIEKLKIYIHKINRGATITDTSRTLFEHGVIQDIDSFVNYARSQDKLIRAGLFQVTEQMTDEQVFTILTGEPLTEEQVNLISIQEQAERIISP